MEFWGIEVKAGQVVKCDPGTDKYLHLSQASLGETKKDKGSTSVPIFVNVDNKKLVIGTLSSDKCAQITYDLVFEKEFELSHGWKDGSVFFVGYKTVVAEDETDSGLSDSDSEDEMAQAVQKANGKPVAKEDPKAAIKAGFQKQDSAPSKGKPVEEPLKLKPDDSDEDESDDDDDDNVDESGDEDESDEEMGESDEDDSSEEEKVTPKKPEVGGKKRPLESNSKTNASDKKLKLVTPGKGEDKKGGHVATPHPAKQAPKTPASEDKSKQQTPKSSGGAFACKSCNKTFNSDMGLQSHTKAKHSAK